MEDYDPSLMQIQLIGQYTICIHCLYNIKDKKSNDSKIILSSKRVSLNIPLTIK